MCGIAGAVSTRANVLISSDGIKAMGEQLQHRGPDDAGFFCDKSVGLAHRRLSIIDVDAPAQPICIDDLVMVYNGEVYNYKALKTELIEEGVVFLSDCDTEVVLQAYKQWGTSAFSRFNGMFALLIFDRKKQSVIVARDRFGIKPLYVGEDIDGCRLFASEMEALKEYDGESHKNWSGSALLHYLRLGYYIEPDTPRHNVRQITPGTYEIHHCCSERWSRHTYWDPVNVIQSPEQPVSNQEGRALLSAAVNQQMQADVPVGSFLSGGLDSGIITALASNGVSPIEHVFSAGFSIAQYDETRAAQQIAEKLNLHHHCLTLQSSMMGGVGDLPELYGGPFADNAALPTYQLAQLASQHVKVVLSGDGADELFFGYRNHRALFAETALKSCLPGWLKSPVLKWLADWYPNSPSMPRLFRAQSTLRALSLSLAEGYCSAMSVVSDETLKKIINPSFWKEHSLMTSEQRFSSIAESCEHDDPMKVMQYLDLKTYLPGSVLTKVDRATMRAGVEARVPFLDNELSERLLRQSSALNLGWGQHKTQLRKWSAGTLPNTTRMRVKKSFTSPLDVWFRGLHYSVFCRMIMSEELIHSGIFNIDALQQLMDNHYAGKVNQGTLLWTVAVLSKTLQKKGGLFL